MKKFRAILSFVPLLALLCSCGQDQDTLDSERSNIENYLKTQNITSYTIQDGVYRYVANADRESYPTDTEAAVGDSIFFMFEAYPFTTGPQQLYYTNKEWKISSDAILNPEFWSFDPVEARIGKTELLKGLTSALPGCKTGDSVVMFITSDLAYGRVAVGVLPSNSAVMMVVNVNNVKK